MIELPSRDMVECSNCLEWFHVDCLQVPVPKDAFQDVMFTPCMHISNFSNLHVVCIMSCFYKIFF